MCHELGLDYTAKLIGPRTGETHIEAFLSINPKGKIPVLVDDELVLSEGAAIITYLPSRHLRRNWRIRAHSRQP